METKVSSNQKIEISVVNTQKDENEKLPSLKNTKNDLIELKKKRFGTRVDLLTGEEFVPLRINQKFANNRNRITYNNEITQEKNRNILLEFKNSKNTDEQKSNWQDVLIYLLSLNEKSPSDKIAFLMTKYSIEKATK